MLKTSLHLFAIAVVLASGTAFGQSNDFADQLMDADEKQFVIIFPKLKEQAEESLPFLISEIDRKLPPDASENAKEKLAKRQANAAVVLLRLNHPSKVWSLLKHSPDPRARSYLIHRLGPLGVDSKIIIKRLEVEPDITIRRALILSLGEFDEKGLSQEDRNALLPKLQEVYRMDSDPGLHAAVEWLLRTWKQDDWLKQVTGELAKDKEQQEHRLEEIGKTLAKDDGNASPQWYVNGQGQTMVVIPGPVEFMMGSPKMEVGKRDNEPQHKSRIELSFAIASKEVTVEQFLRFRRDQHYQKQFAPTGDCPVNFETWYEAVAYCNWLSHQEGIPTNQWCYEPNKDGKYEAGTTTAPDYLQRTGYRLPTEAEWEYACRAGSVTRYSFGGSDDLLAKYAWFVGNSLRMSHPVGSLRPNDLGVFDMHGNISEWCEEAYEPNDDRKAQKDQVGNLAVRDANGHVVRGGSFTDQSSLVRSAFRLSVVPSYRLDILGFRLVRTIPPAPDKSP